MLDGLDTLVIFGEKTILVNELVALDINHPLDAPFKSLEYLKDQAQIGPNAITVAVFQDKTNNDDELVILVACAQAYSRSNGLLIHVTSSDPELGVYHSKFPDVTEQLPRTDNKENDGAFMPWQWDSGWSLIDSKQNEHQIMLRVSLIALRQHNEKLHKGKETKFCLQMQHIPDGLKSLQLLHGGEAGKIQLASNKEGILSKALCLVVTFP